MIDTNENIQETEREWEKLIEESGITDEMVDSPEYDYLD